MVKWLYVCTFVSISNLPEGKKKSDSMKTASSSTKVTNGHISLSSGMYLWDTMEITKSKEGGYMLHSQSLNSSKYKHLLERASSLQKNTEDKGSFSLGKILSEVHFYNLIMAWEVSQVACYFFPKMADWVERVSITEQVNGAESSTDPTHTWIMATQWPN